jgi:hypothetical protein
LELLEEMGFEDEDRNRELLRDLNNDPVLVMERYLDEERSMGSQAALWRNVHMTRKRPITPEELHDPSSLKAARTEKAHYPTHPNTREASSRLLEGTKVCAIRVISAVVYYRIE